MQLHFTSFIRRVDLREHRVHKTYASLLVEHQRGERGNRASAEFHNILSFLAEMMAGQESLQPQTEEGTQKDAPRTR